MAPLSVLVYVLSWLGGVCSWLHPLWLRRLLLCWLGLGGLASCLAVSMCLTLVLDAFRDALLCSSALFGLFNGKVGLKGVLCGTLVCPCVCVVLAGRRVLLAASIVAWKLAAVLAWPWRSCFVLGCLNVSNFGAR